MGWEEANHPWSHNGKKFTAVELLDFFVKVVLPLAKSKKVPKEPPITLQGLPDMNKFGTRADDVLAYCSKQESLENTTHLQALQEQEKSELLDIGDTCEYLNSMVWPKKQIAKGFKIEMLFV